MLFVVLRKVFSDNDFSFLRQRFHNFFILLCFFFQNSKNFVVIWKPHISFWIAGNFIDGLPFRRFFKYLCNFAAHIFVAFRQRYIRFSRSIGLNSLHLFVDFEAFQLGDTVLFFLQMNVGEGNAFPSILRGRRFWLVGRVTKLNISLILFLDNLCLLFREDFLVGEGKWSRVIFHVLEKVLVLGFQLDLKRWSFFNYFPFPFIPHIDSVEGVFLVAVYFLQNSQKIFYHFVFFDCYFFVGKWIGSEPNFDFAFLRP